MNAQLQIRQNALEAQEFARDLAQWTQSVSHKSAGQQAGQQQTDQNVPNVRGRAPGSVQAAPASMQQPALQPRKVSAARPADRPPAAHTYSNYSKWDKFDPDAAHAAQDQPAALTESAKQSYAAASKPGSPQPCSLFQPAAQQTGAAEQQPDRAVSSSPAAEATALKDRGNKLFQAGYYQDAVSCYTQSIAQQPTSMAYANRAMAQLKLGQPAEAEHDCSAALQLNSSYVKALHRRGTARRQLGRLLEAANDFEEALRLEPGNATVQADRDAALQQHLQQQKLQESSAAWSSIPVVMPPGPQQLQQQEEQEERVVAEAISSQRVAVLDSVAPASSAGAGVADNTAAAAAAAAAAMPVNYSTATSAAAPATRQPLSRSSSSQQTPTAAAAAAAAALAARRAASLKAPKTGNDFEAAWRSFKGDLQLQAKYLALVSAQQLPTIVKTSLTAPMLRDILTAALTAVPGSAAAAARSDADSGTELTAGHAVNLLQQLPQLPRFDMTAMCLTSRDKAGLRELWDAAAAACSPGTAEQLAAVRPMYRL